MKRFACEEGGQGLVEYAILLGLVATGVILAMTFFRTQIGNVFSNIGNSLAHPSPTPDN